VKATYFIHILAGTLGLLTGYVALFVVKGGTVHRRAGMIFVYMMVTMCVGGLAIALVRGIAPEINVAAALITAYLVMTSLTTVRPASPRVGRAIALSGMAVALGVLAVMSSFAVEAISNGGTRNGMPAFPFVMFATFAALGLWGDIRVMRSGLLKGGARLARHLWRMSMALFIAALSFSVQAAKLLRQQDIPVPGPLIAVPMLLVLGAMFYWLWRLNRRRVSGLVLRTAAG
jgi:hypothetical protein